MARIFIVSGFNRVVWTSRGLLWCFQNFSRESVCPGRSDTRTCQRKKSLDAFGTQSMAVAEDGHTRYFENMPEQNFGIFHPTMTAIG
jgi:hypothetical protein